MERKLFEANNSKTVEEILQACAKLNKKGSTISAVFYGKQQIHRLITDALTAYRTAVLSALEKGEDILKIDIEKFGK